MNGEERNNQQFQQHHYGGIVQGIPVANDPSAPLPPAGVSQGYIPPPYPPPTAAPVPSTGASQNHAPAPPPPLHHMSGVNSTAADTPSSAAVGSATATAVSSTTNINVDLGPRYDVIKDDSLPCGCGSGWFMFIIGWFFAIPWYVGACILICGKIDRRERPGHIACAVMAGFFTVALIIASTHRASNGY